MLKIKNIHSEINSQPVLRGLNLEINAGEIHAIMGPNGSGKSTLASVISGNENHEVTDGDVLYFNQSILDCSPEERARMGIFMSFQYPVEIPGVSVSNFVKTSVNEVRKSLSLPPMKTSELLKKMKENLSLLNMGSEFLSRSINDGFSGGEKKRNEIFQMAMLNPKLSILDETDSGLDIDALKIVSNGVNKLKSPNNSFIIITHYQRLLNYIKPDYVHVLHEGKIVKSGDAGLALELEKSGYDKIIN
jgi:Fe-S cluster assembly ATP-binding protein